MTQIELKFAELHNSLFLSGKNFGLKLDPGKLHGLKLIYDRAEKELLVHWGQDIGIIPISNVASMVPGEPIQPTPQHMHPIVAGIQSAQVETPMSHVHAGHGHGKTGLSGRVK